MKWIIAVILAFAGVANAQTVAPVVSEYGRKANGSFKVQNNTLQPVATTIEAYSFSLNKEGQHMRPLDPTVHVELSQTSARLSPLEIHEIGYKIKCDVMPCMVALLTGMTVGHTTDGVQVRLILAHAVYVCEKQKDCRRHILDDAGLVAKK